MIFFLEDDLELIRFLGGGRGGGGLKNIEIKDPLKGCYKTLDFNPKTMISKDLVVAYH
jgi:hypothetical protein